MSLLELTTITIGAIASSRGAARSGHACSIGILRAASIGIGICIGGLIVRWFVDVRLGLGLMLGDWVGAAAAGTAVGALIQRVQL